VRRGIVGAAVAMVVLVGACGSTVPSSAPASAAAASAATTVATAPIAIPSTTPGATIPMPSGAATTLDPSLMALLPATVGGVAVTQESQSLAEAIADRAFVASVDRAAFPIAVSGSDLASGVVAHLRAGVFSDKMFTDWRSSYDQGACASSAGVVAHAEQTLGGRTTYVTTCGGGLRVYQAYVPSKGVIVSLFSTGPADLGGQLMGQLQG